MVIHSKDYGVTSRFADPFLAQQWVEYHEINARLRCVCRRCNLSTIRKTGPQKSRFATGTAASRLFRSALFYAMKMGWPVFPLRPREKTPATGHGFKDASLDEAQVRKWWSESLYEWPISRSSRTGVMRLGCLTDRPDVTESAT